MTKYRYTITFRGVQVGLSSPKWVSATLCHIAAIELIDKLSLTLGRYASELDYDVTPMKG